MGSHWSGEPASVLKMVRGTPWKLGLQERASRTGLAVAKVKRAIKEATSLAENIFGAGENEMNVGGLYVKMGWLIY